MPPLSFLGFIVSPNQIKMDPEKKQGVEADPYGASPATTSATQTMFTSITGLRHGSASVSSLSSGYHPESNGQTEQLNQELETCLRCLVAQNQTTWSNHLTGEYAHNTLPTAFHSRSSTVTATSLPRKRRGGDRSLSPCPDKTMQKDLGCSQADALQGTDQDEGCSSHRRPAPTYQLGQTIWLSTKVLPLHVHSCKLAPRFVGPFPVSKVVTPVSVRLKLPRSLHVHPTFHVSKLKPVKESPLVPPSKPSLPPKMVGGPVYAVKKLLAVRKRGWGRQFLVDLEGYGPEERSWIPASFIVDQSHRRFLPAAS
ncbi:hypothetical protein L3Q82_000390 [Scortum barcoo]|uniref:Uncharacterized protein n=1 Tax=Scortum barcoo TaxID=214431 RepID=A0ACB8XA53_9TELE|nr:hypothetical protein L3Q82_000390 [Scortum barcoo]